MTRNPFKCAKNGQGKPVIQLSEDQRQEIIDIVKRDDCELFLQFIDAAASDYRMWEFMRRLPQRTVRYVNTGRGQPPDRLRRKLAWRIASAYQGTFHKKPSPWDNTRFNKIMRIVFDAADCAVDNKRHREILKKALQKNIAE